MQLPIYLDYAATTPVDPRVAEAMMKCLTLDGNFGNPASRSHIYGWRAEEAVEDARGHVARLINADPREIVWTSGATEANNLALKGVIDGILAAQPGRTRADCHIITSAIEHKAVLDTCAALQEQGVRVTYLQPQSNGLVHLEQIDQAITEGTCVVSLMQVNNEIGVINDIAAIGQFCRGKGILIHVDAAQAAGKEFIDVKQFDTDLLSLSAHKMYGPKGIGALFVRRSDEFRVAAQIHGGGHERRMRSGTLATHQIVGFGEAARIAVEALEVEQLQLKTLRDYFWQGLRQLPGVAINGATDKRTAGILNVQFSGVDGENLVMALRDLAVSTGSACTSASLEPSYVLRGIGVDDVLAHSSLRFSLGRFTQKQEIDFAIEKIVSVVNAMRQMNQVG